MHPYLVAEGQNGNPDTGCFFPAVINTLEVMIEELLQFIRRLFRVQVRPFLFWVDTEPVE